MLRERVDLPDLVRTVVDTLKLFVERNRNALEVTCEGARDIETDGEKVRQIIRNLLDNACKFTQDGVVRLRVRARDGKLLIDVSDSGIGIPADQFDLLFEPFRQVDMGDARRFGGTGLGLAITKNLCQLLDGTIAVDSAPGAGARFRVEIPLSLATFESQAVIESRPLDPPHMHADAMLGPQRQGGFRNYPPVGRQGQMKFLENSRHDDHHF